MVLCDICFEPAVRICTLCEVGGCLSLVCAKEGCFEAAHHPAVLAVHVTFVRPLCALGSGGATPGSRFDSNRTELHKAALRERCEEQMSQPPDGGVLFFKAAHRLALWHLDNAYLTVQLDAEIVHLELEHRAHCRALDDEAFSSASEEEEGEGSEQCWYCDKCGSANDLEQFECECVVDSEEEGEEEVAEWVNVTMSVHDTATEGSECDTSDSGVKVEDRYDTETPEVSEGEDV